MKKGINYYDYQPSDDTSEYNEEPSQTIPNESYTITELLEKFTAGINLPVQRNGEFDDIDDFDAVDISRVPGTDIVDVTDKISEIQNHIEEQKKAKNKQKTDEVKDPNEVTDPNEV